MTIGQETELTDSYFKLISDTARELSYTLPLDANGASDILINVNLRDDVSFAGKDSIKIKTYIAFNAPFLRNIIKFEVGSDSIDINPSN